MCEKQQCWEGPTRGELPTGARGQQARRLPCCHCCPACRWLVAEGPALWPLCGAVGMECHCRGSRHLTQESCWCSVPWEQWAAALTGQLLTILTCACFLLQRACHPQWSPAQQPSSLWSGTCACLI